MWCQKVHCYEVIRFVSMKSVGSIAAPDCRTSQSKGRYCARTCTASFPVVVEFVTTCFKLWTIRNSFFFAPMTDYPEKWIWHCRIKKIRFTDASGPGHLLKMICQNRSTVTSDLRVRRQFFTLWSMIFEVFLAELVIRQHDFAFTL